VDGREFKNAIFEQLARVGAALGSAKRLEIIDVLAQADRSVETIAEATAMTIANTSRHLQVLRQAGLVSAKRDGNYVRYSIADDSVLEGYRTLRSVAQSRIAEVHQLASAFFGDVEGAESVGLDELLERSRAGEVVIIDVRPRVEFDAGHLRGALSIPLDELSTRLGELDRDTAVVAYCRGPYCVFGAEAVAQLRSAGLSAQRLSEGPLDWDPSLIDVGVALSS
jgi:DNA-binding transcriptional ArsR family regulator/rhodanese-related sulfurtransferase